MKRQRLELREENFTYDDKQTVIQKSGCKCCHCGTPISIGYNFTIDHFVPLSQGGTNRMINLIGLCDECNKGKDSELYDPDDYLKFIDDKYKQQIKGYYNSYMKAFEYLHRGNLLKNDVYEYRSWIPTNHGKTAFRGSKTKKLGMPYYLKRVFYDDLDELLEYYIEYLKKYNLYTMDSLAKANLSFWFQYCALYCVRKRNDELMGFFMFDISYSGERVQRLHGIMYVTPFFRYSSAINQAVVYQCISNITNEIMIEQNFGYFPVILSCCKSDNVVRYQSIKSGFQGDSSRFDNYVDYYVMCRSDDNKSNAKDSSELSDEEVEKINAFFRKFDDENTRLRELLDACTSLIDFGIVERE